VERATFTALIGAVLGPRVRVTLDEEGWPQVPARYGTLRWRGREWQTGAARIWAYTDRPRLIARLHRIPGVHRRQTGDREAEAWVAAEDGAAVRAVAALLKTRRRRASSSGNAAELAKARAQRRGPA
jgi:hypothetical protein